MMIRIVKSKQKFVKKTRLAVCGSEVRKVKDAGEAVKPIVLAIADAFLWNELLDHYNNLSILGGVLLSLIRNFSPPLLLHRVLLGYRVSLPNAACIQLKQWAQLHSQLSGFVLDLVKQELRFLQDNICKVCCSLSCYFKAKHS